jgi:archaellum biogenesis protein FlaJ (TadC family)
MHTTIALIIVAAVLVLLTNFAGPDTIFPAFVMAHIIGTGLVLAAMRADDRARAE